MLKYQCLKKFLISGKVWFKSMRAFIAIDFSRELKNEIAAFQEMLRPYAMRGRWKYIDNFHLTLKFLGEISDSKVKDICNVIDEACSTSEPFILNISKLGMFPGKGNIRVLWLGIGGQTDRLLKLQAKLDILIETLGFEREKRPFTPHITIGQDIVFSKNFDEIKRDFTPERFEQIKVDRVLLVKSEQMGNKRVYTPVYESSLAK